MQIKDSGPTGVTIYR